MPVDFGGGDGPVPGVLAFGCPAGGASLGLLGTWPSCLGEAPLLVLVGTAVGALALATDKSGGGAFEGTEAATPFGAHGFSDCCWAELAALAFITA